METYEGSCHCKTVRYTAELDLSHPAIECNCSHCSVKCLLLEFVPEDQFEILSGEENLNEYRFNKHHIAHLFCATCGVQPFAKAPGPDGNVMMAINLRTIEGINLDDVPRQPYNGKDI